MKTATKAQLVQWVALKTKKPVGEVETMLKAVDECVQTYLSEGCKEIAVTANVRLKVKARKARKTKLFGQGELKEIPAKNVVVLKQSWPLEREANTKVAPEVEVPPALPSSGTAS